MTDEQLKQFMAMDPITAKGVDYALDMWQKAALVAMQAMITGREVWDDAKVAKEAFIIADAMLAEAGKRIPGKMEELIKSESAQS